MRTRFGVFGAVLLAAGLAWFGSAAADERFASNFDGFSVGIQAGYGFGKGGLSDDDDSAEYNSRGAAVGAIIGYDHRFQSGLVVGIEADLFYVPADGETEVEPNIFLIGEQFLDVSVRPRIGYQIGRFMPYATGGAIFRTFEVGAESRAPGQPIETASIDEEAFGWTLGGGAEIALRQGVNLRLEYRFARTDHTVGESDEDPDAVYSLSTVTAGVKVSF